MHAQRIALLVAALVALHSTGCHTPAPRKPPPSYQPRPKAMHPRVVRTPPRTYYPPLAPLPPLRQVQPRPRPAPPIVKPAPPVSGTFVTAAQIRPPAGIDRGRWQVIVVHHSADEDATPTSMDRYHRITRGWKHGLGYHFVIGNGDQYPDGKIFVGNRWKQQLEGAHCATSAGKFFGVSRPAKFFNHKGIGVCMIGNMEQTGPTARQRAALQQLVVLLCKAANVSPSQVYGHGEVTRRTQCPGRLTNMTQLRSGLAAAYRVAGGLACGDVADELPDALPEFDEAELALALGIPVDAIEEDDLPPDAAHFNSFCEVVDSARRVPARRDCQGLQSLDLDSFHQSDCALLTGRPGLAPEFLPDEPFFLCPGPDSESAERGARPEVREVQGTTSVPMPRVVASPGRSTGRPAVRAAGAVQRGAAEVMTPMAGASAPPRKHGQAEYRLSVPPLVPPFAPPARTTIQLQVRPTFGPAANQRPTIVAQPPRSAAATTTSGIWPKLQSASSVLPGNASLPAPRPGKPFVAPSASRPPPLKNRGLFGLGVGRDAPRPLSAPGPRWAPVAGARATRPSNACKGSA